MLSLPVQLPLSVQLRDDATFANFYTGQNGALIAMLDLDRGLQESEPEQFIYLYGDHRCGCSHLLQAACHQVDGRARQSIYLPMSELVHYSPNMLEGIERLQLVCIDDIDAIAGIRVWEEALFDLFNRLRDAQTRLIVAARHAPKQVGIVLPDLVSRLGWGMVFQVQPLDEAERLEALKLRARLRGFVLADEVARFIIHRGPNNTGELFDLLEKLDNASLRAKRKITIPFVKSVMAA